MVHQHFMLIEDMTGLENIILGDKRHNSPLLQIADDRKTIEELMDRYGMEIDLDEKVGDMSIGMQQRVEIMKVLFRGADLVILDEPTAGLDPAGCRGVLENIAAYRRETGSAVLLVTHSMDDAARIADRLIVFHDGHVAFDGTPAEVFAHTQALLDIGLDVPQSARIAQALRDRGVALPPSIYTLEQLTDALLAVGKEAGVC